MITKVFSIAIIIGLGVFTMLRAQHPKQKGEANLNEVLIKSWKKGEDSFQNQVFRMVLSTSQNQYEQEVVSSSGRRYRLFAIHNLYSTLPYENWTIELREILESRKGRVKKVGSNLLRTQELLSGTHYFPKEDTVGDIYPEENATAFSSDGEPLYGGGYEFYFFKTIRKIVIEKFCVIIKVGKYQFNPIEKKKLDFLEVFIEFNNSCDGSLIEAIQAIE